MTTTTPAPSATKRPARRVGAPKRLVRKTATKRVTKKKVVEKTAPKTVAKTTSAKRADLEKPAAEIVGMPVEDSAAAPVAGRRRSSTKKPVAKAAVRKRPSRRSAVDRIDDPPPSAGLPLLDRVTGAIERELTLIERIIGVRTKAEQRTEAERRARTLASLARTLAEVRRLRVEEHKTPSNDDSIPRDLDEFRRALSRRLDRMVGDAAGVPAAGHE